MWLLSVDDFVSGRKDTEVAPDHDIRVKNEVSCGRSALNNWNEQRWQVHVALTHQVVSRRLYVAPSRAAGRTPKAVGMAVNQTDKAPPERLVIALQNLVQVHRVRVVNGGAFGVISLVEYEIFDAKRVGTNEDSTPLGRQSAQGISNLGESDLADTDVRGGYGGDGPAVSHAVFPNSYYDDGRAIRRIDNDFRFLSVRLDRDYNTGCLDIDDGGVGLALALRTVGLSICLGSSQVAFRERFERLSFSVGTACRGRHV